MRQGNMFECKSNNKLYGIPQNINTLPKFLKYYSQKYILRRCLGTREFLKNGLRGQYEWYSYGQFYYYTILLAKGLKLYGFNQGDVVGLASSNRPEWMIVSFACSILGVQVVIFNENQQIEEIKYITDTIKLKGCFCSIDCLKVVETIKEKYEFIIVLDDIYDDRAQIQRYKEFNSSWKVEIPMFTCFQKHSQYYFDDIDKTQGIYDPSLNKATFPDANDLCKKTIRQKANENGFYSYILPQADVQMLISTQNTHSQEFLAVATHTFHQIIQRGYLAIFDDTKNYFALEDASQIMEACFSLLNKAQQPDVCLISFTLVTTGQEKTYKITHTNILWGTIMQMYIGMSKRENVLNSLKKATDNSQEFFLSTVSAPNILTLSMQLASYGLGSAIGFLTSKIQGFIDDLTLLRPTIVQLFSDDVKAIRQRAVDLIQKFSSLKRGSYRKALKARQKFLDEKIKECEGKIFKLFKEQKERIKMENGEDINYSASHLNPLEFVQYSLNYQIIKQDNNIFDAFKSILGGRCRLFLCHKQLSYDDIYFVKSHFNVAIQTGWEVPGMAGYIFFQAVINQSYREYFVLDKNTKIALCEISENAINPHIQNTIRLADQQIDISMIHGKLLISGPSLAIMQCADSKENNKQVKQDEFLDTGLLAQYNVLSGAIYAIDNGSDILT